MALDFPASPARGDRYTPAGGPSYLFDGVAWAPAVPALRKVAMPWCVAAREVGDEKLPVGPMGILGSYAINIGSWNGAYIPGGGVGLVVPQTGQYRIRNRVYHNPQPTDPSGRICITVNGVQNGNFVHLPSAAIAALTLENTTVHALSKGDVIAYEIAIATAAVYTKFRHTEVEVVRLPDGWEAAPAGHAALDWEAT